MHREKHECVPDASGLFSQAQQTIKAFSQKKQEVTWTSEHNNVISKDVHFENWSVFFDFVVDEISSVFQIPECVTDDWEAKVS